MILLLCVDRISTSSSGFDKSPPGRVRVQRRRLPVPTSSSLDCWLWPSLVRTIAAAAATADEKRTFTMPTPLPPANADCATDFVSTPPLTDCFHSMLWTSSSWVRWASLPRFLINLGSSFWNLEADKRPGVELFRTECGETEISVDGTHTTKQILTSRPNESVYPASCGASPP